MKQKRLLIIYAVSICIFCGLIVFRSMHREKSRETVVTFSSFDDSTSFVTSTVQSISTNYAMQKASMSTTFSTRTVTEKIEKIPIYIDINTADAEDLCRLNGIGNELASAIIRYREENGGFNNIEEIMNIHGIGEGTFDEICDYIYVENPYYPEDDISDDISDDENHADYPEESEEVEDIIEETEVPTEPPLTLEDVIPINLNTADVELLILLPHIDEEIAERIIDFREKIGGFSHSYELLYIENLTREKTNEILDYVCVEDAETENEENIQDSNLESY